MAATDKPSHTPIMAISSHETALCVIPPLDQCGDIDRLRSLYDKGYGKWPPHINLIYPFVAPECLPQAKQQIEATIAHTLSDDTPRVALSHAGHFQHRANHTIFLSGSLSGMQSLSVLRDTALRALEQPSTDCNFHLTIGQSENLSESSREFLKSKTSLLPQLEFPVHQLAILVRERVPGQGSTTSRMRLWGTINVSSDAAAGQSMPLSEFWLQTVPLAMDAEEDDDVDSEDSTLQSSFNREVQPGATYQYDTETSQWCATCDTSHEEGAPQALAVASYNVLIESEYPPTRERDLLLRQAILSPSAVADILVLQEMSDGFLSFLLSDAQMQHRYPFASHGPPSQQNIGPLPSLRNVVILSKFPFTWEMVPFHRRHKSAVIAKFHTIGRDNGRNMVPLIVAGVHLTCGLTDGSVAAKKTQVLNLKTHLSRHYPDNPWIIAGDFNITTSNYTIETALRSKSISQQTTKTLASIETLLSDSGMVDAWSIARIEATDDSSAKDVDDLFEGEDGATFNPQENQLAAATSGTSNNRPQRYDRILVRPQGLLQIGRFNQFGLPETQHGLQLVPSDHSGIRTTMRVLADSKEDPTDKSDSLKQHPVLPMHATAALADLTSALEAHKIFPTEEEMDGRQAAFTLIKEVLLGSSDDGDTTESDIPMVIVPVGSYALGVWTSASDIDCLCIGSISSKTFFKLARQRILRAAARNVRLLRKVEAGTGTMLELSVNGVSMDLQYCPAAGIVERWAELPALHHSDSIFNLSMLSLRKLKPYRDIAYIQRSLPSLPTFRLAYRCIKLWAVQRGIYSSKFGYIGGIHITLMLSWVYKRLAHDTGVVTAADLVLAFFQHYAQFDWKNDMVFDAFFHKSKPRYQRSAREPVVILGYHAPNANVAHTFTVPGLATLVKELSLANSRLSQEGMTWQKFFGFPSKSAVSNELAVGIPDFLKTYDSYVQINIQYWGRSLSNGKGLVGWVESRSLLLVVDINKALPDLEVRIWPGRFTNSEPSVSEADYQGCYLVGLSRSSNAQAYQTKDEKSVAKQALEKVFSRYLSQLQADEKYYDPNTCWIGISLVKPNEVRDLRLDDREWGDYIPDLEVDSDDEDDAEDLIETEESSTRHIPIRPSPSSTPVSSSKLRPASDVLNRLRWDPNLDPSDYIVGYEDRFLGAKETSLERWKTEQTDEEFIPQHRILYFKRKGDGVVVWERRTRVDLVFGSGVGAG